MRLRRKFGSLIARWFYPDALWMAEFAPELAPKYVLWQRILNVNGVRHVPWPVHFTSVVSGNVTAEWMSAPGFGMGCYVNAMNGVHLGRNVFIGPGVKIISANHDLYDRSHHLASDPIRIRDNVWIGANTVILPSVEIGENTVIGAGSVVTRSLPANVVAFGNPARVQREL